MVSDRDAGVLGSPIAVATTLVPPHSRLECNEARISAAVARAASLMTRNGAAQLFVAGWTDNFHRGKLKNESKCRVSF